MTPISRFVVICTFANFCIACMEIQLEPTPLPFQHDSNKYTGLTQPKASTCYSANCDEFFKSYTSALRIYESATSLYKSVKVACSDILDPDEVEFLEEITITACFDDNYLRRSATSRVEATILTSSIPIKYMEQMQGTDQEEILMEATPLPFQHGLTKYTGLSESKAQTCITGDCDKVLRLALLVSSSAGSSYKIVSTVSKSVAEICSSYSISSITSTVTVCITDDDDDGKILGRLGYATSGGEATIAATSAAMTFMQQMQTAGLEASL
ncbi:unnamed protein product [Orchesella dallaii]|uniref:Uncharacterized protein n=1 Tax=Orchesella dallaii TaxID=48710 RepID=A0ABP1RGH2_9HEXA